MSKRLEKFMQDHREEFDSEVPGPQVWAKLEKELVPASSQAKVISLKKNITLRIARLSAAAVILLLAGLGVYHLMRPTAVDPSLTGKTPAAVSNPKEEELLKEINPAYAQEVYHFTKLIELKQSELKQLEKDQPALYSQFISDIRKLDSSYNNLKGELPTNPNREQLLEAMIQNLRLQTELLNQQLQIIQEIKQSKNKSHESASKSI